MLALVLVLSCLLSSKCFLIVVRRLVEAAVQDCLLEVVENEVEGKRDCANAFMEWKKLRLPAQMPCFRLLGAFPRQPRQICIMIVAVQTNFHLQASQ